MAIVGGSAINTSLLDEVSILMGAAIDRGRSRGLSVVKGAKSPILSILLKKICKIVVIIW